MLPARQIYDIITQFFNKNHEIRHRKKEDNVVKRHQVLLEDWQVDYLRFIAKNYDISFSEAIRSLLSLASIQIIKEWYPKYKYNVSFKQIIQGAKKMQAGRIKKSEFHKIISQIYFEARKAIEFRMARVKK
jgi:sulfur relay (sulfurtransferase) DsrC/TusE family protein